ncbi:Hexokinase-1 [Thalictrum thalictroides]|uniref:Phosphotransferase n=1 Tax=Thalictrum thalictroides TaxID=46969 RepID=A0A7J6X0T2_THATH|nr:Hexokinase-1 [Thalictrum thalictroides]
MTMNTMMTERRKEVMISVAVGAIASAALFLLRHWQKSSRRRWKRTQRFLHRFAAECSTPIMKLWHVADDLVLDMQAGLSSESERKSKLRSNVHFLPTGDDQEGLYYGLNLCVTEIQLSRVHVGGNNVQESKSVPIPSNVTRNSSSEELFYFIAMELSKFVSTESFEGGAKRQNRLGFTYSLALEQDPISSGSTIKWKSFSNNDTVAKDMVDKFNKALEKYGVDMRISAMVDETIGNLIGDRNYNDNVVAAITLAMGTNAAYVETISPASNLIGPPPMSEEMVIDTRWRNFNSTHFPLTQFDIQLDAESSNPGEHNFEKLVSGMYLGEIVRRVLVKMAKETALFGDSIPPELNNPYVLRSPDMASMHQDTSENREVIGEKLREVFKINDTTPMVREIVADVCDIVVERGARLAGAGILGILKKLERIDTTQKSVVTVEGGLYQHYRLFRNYMHSGIWEMLGNEFSDSLTIQNSSGGSGIGAVFLAASQSHSIESP